jgi:hypothetical protein
VKAKPKVRTPQVGWLNPDWKYIPANRTNILARFRAMGWTPPSEAKGGAAE